MKIKVLIADDHAIVRDGLCALLEANPDMLVIGDAADGKQALAQANSLQPDIVIMDISMPELDGIEATRQLLEGFPSARVIILSMLGTLEHVVRSLEAGATGFLLKESAGRQVVEAIRTVYAGNFYFSQPVMNSLVTDYLKQRREFGSQSRLDMLSQREREILPLVVAGKTSAEIAQVLFLSPKTVESYRSRMMRKLGTPDIASLVKFALQEGLVN